MSASRAHFPADVTSGELRRLPSAHVFEELAASLQVRLPASFVPVAILYIG